MYDIPDDAVLLKEGLYVQYIQSGENTLISFLQQRDMQSIMCIQQKKKEHTLIEHI